MSSTRTPKTPSSSPRPSVSGHALGLALLPWPAVAAGLFLCRSALVAFALYASVCVYGTWRLARPSLSLRPTWPVATHLSIAVAFNAALVGLWLLLGRWVLPADFLMARLQSVGVTPASFLWLFPYFLLGNPLIEERFWRGALREGGPLFSSLLFGAWHALPIFLIAPLWVAPLAVLGVMLVGLVLGQIVQSTGSLGDAVLVHALAADLPLLIIVWIASH